MHLENGAPTKSDIPAYAAALSDTLIFDALLPGFNDLVKEAVISYEKVTAMSQGAVDPLLDMVLVGKLMALVGVLQSHILAPQGPVDPVEKLKVQRNYAEEKVSKCFLSDS